MSNVPAVVYTDAHMIAGHVLVKERLQELLVDRLTDFLDLTDVTISSLSQPDRMATTAPKVTVPKPKIAVVTMDMPTHESEETRRNKQSPKSGSKVCAIVEGLEIFGTAHLNSAGDLASRILTQQLRSFFPITDASLVLTHRETNNTLSTQLVLVNRERVNAFVLL